MTKDRKLLIQYLDGSLNEQEKPDVEALLRKAPTAERELEEIRQIMASIRENPGVFCPTPSEICRFTESEVDFPESFADHINNCLACKELADTFRSAEESGPMPDHLFEALTTAAVPDEAEMSPPLLRDSGSSLLEWVREILRVRYLVPAAAMAAAVLAVLLYSPTPPGERLALSSETLSHSETGTSDRSPDSVTGRPDGHTETPDSAPRLGAVQDAGKGHLIKTAILIFVKTDKRTLSQPEIDALYRSAASAPYLQRLNIVAPLKVREVLEEERLTDKSRKDIVVGLRRRLKIDLVAAVTVGLFEKAYVVEACELGLRSGKAKGRVVSLRADKASLNAVVRQAVQTALSPIHDPDWTPVDGFPR